MYGVQKYLTAILTAFAFMGICQIQAIDLSEGRILAVPVPNGKAPVIDGDLADWDLSAAEPVFISQQTAPFMNADWALMYDDDALYISAKVAMPHRALFNPCSPVDAYWQGDILQARLLANPGIPQPLDLKRDAAVVEAAHVNLWKNTETGVDYLVIAHGLNLDLGTSINPVGSAVSIKPAGDLSYIAEARIPWSALNVPGGKNPFKAGEQMPFLAETLWGGGDQSRVAAVYRVNPGNFGFASPQRWGSVGFADKGFEGRRRPSMEEFVRSSVDSGSEVKGVPIKVTVPEEGLKLSVNILGANGEVIRELVGGEVAKRGDTIVMWDGFDQWGHPMKPGTYRWGALLHHPLTAEYVGSVGTSGKPPYPSADGKGAWGGDHSNPIDCAADTSGYYLLWPVAEMGRPVVKVDPEGNVLWRKNPFVGGGFGPFYAIATDGAHIYLSLGADEVRLVRLDAEDGRLLSWGEGGPTELPVYQSPLLELSEKVVPIGVHDDSEPSHTLKQPNPVGLAVHGGLLYVSDYAGNKIHILESATGKRRAILDWQGPRGLAVDKDGTLFVAFLSPSGEAGIVKFISGSSKPVVVAKEAVEAPYGVAIGEAGHLFVSDLGSSHQVKEFDAQGNLVRSLGKMGGRAWQGEYDASAFLNPAGLAWDGTGGLLVAESSPPKVFSHWEVATQNSQARWFGPGAYWNATWPMPDDPENIFYTLSDAFGRAYLGKGHETGVPQAYWQMDRAGYPQVGNQTNMYPQPEVVVAKNGRTYFVNDSGNHAIFVFEGESLRPVATWVDQEGAHPSIAVWVDANGDGQVQEAEKSQLTKLASGAPAPLIGRTTSSMHMQPNGDLYFMTQNNAILRVPASELSKNGTIRWNLAGADYSVPEVIPGKRDMLTTWRSGLLGVRLDGAGNQYTVFNTRLDGTGLPHDYVSKEAADARMNGLGHTSSFNTVKFAKFDQKGELLWMAGRKATAGARPGEMYHMWNLAGLVNDRYVAGGSEWGPIYFYTADGFYIDAIMSNPALNPLPGPYTFSGETSGGRVAFFPMTGDVWAYSSGMAYRVKGFTNGTLDGEVRVEGSVNLDKLYESENVKDISVGPIKIVPIKGRPLHDEESWLEVPRERLIKDGRELATVQVGYDQEKLYARFRVEDPSPHENSAEEGALAFKGGDSVALVFGPAGTRAQAETGDVRLIAAKTQGELRVFAMKAKSAQEKRPFTYSTPAGGVSAFDFVGEVPGGMVSTTPAPGGYVITFSVPRKFLEVDILPGASLLGDAEVRLSGAGARGLQTMSRSYLFTPARPETTMIDDVPTESRMYPQYWGRMEVR